MRKFVELEHPESTGPLADVNVLSTWTSGCDIPRSCALLGACRMTRLDARHHTVYDFRMKAARSRD